MSQTCWQRGLVEHAHGKSLPEGALIRYNSTLTVDPELADTYAQYYGVPSRTFRLYRIKQKTGPFRLTLCPLTTHPPAFEGPLPEVLRSFERHPGLEHGQALIYTSRPGLEALPDDLGIYSPVSGGRYIVGGLRYEVDGTEHSTYVRPEVCDYFRLFVLSNCVRYKQEFWVRTIQGDIPGGTALANLSVSLARMRFPTYVLSSLVNEPIEYGVPSR